MSAQEDGSQAKVRTSGFEANRLSPSLDSCLPPLSDHNAHNTRAIVRPQRRPAKDVSSLILPVRRRTGLPPGKPNGSSSSTVLALFSPHQTRFCRDPSRRLGSVVWSLYISGARKDALSPLARGTSCFLRQGVSRIPRPPVVPLRKGTKRSRASVWLDPQIDPRPLNEEA